VSRLSWLVVLVMVACTSKPRPPDVLLIVMDTVRADRLQTYGAERPTSRQLSAIAGAGVRFTDTTADGSWTWPSHASLFTGEPPWVHGAHWSAAPEDAGVVNPKTGYWQVSPMRSDLPTLAERFGAAGYQTVALSSNSLLDPALGLTRGFERAEWLKRDSNVVEAARALMAQPTDKPLFLMINLMAAHSPYTVAPEVPWSVSHRRMFMPQTTPGWMKPYKLSRIPPALALTERRAVGGLTGEEAYAKGELKLRPEDLSFIRDLYDGELIRLDKALALLVAGWTGSGRTRDIVAVTSDHGEYLGEHGQIGHGLTVFPEVTHVPMVIAAPGRLPAGTTVATPVQLSDLYGTLLDLSGVAPGEPGSLRGVIEGEVRPGPIQAAAWPMAEWAGHVGGRFKLGHRLYREGKHVLMTDTSGGAGLYELSEDPGMVRDRSAQDPTRLERMRAASADAFPESVSAGQVQVPDEALRQLQALGYME
jgi:arylsulfatase A-like enzyme